jgi:hypothetical protein
MKKLSIIQWFNMMSLMALLIIGFSMLSTILEYVSKEKMPTWLSILISVFIGLYASTKNYEK